MPILTVAFFFLAQVDNSAAPVSPSGTNALVEMMKNTGPVAMFVLATLLFASIYSWTVILGKMSQLRHAAAESRRFIRAFRKATRLQEIATLAADCRRSPLAQVFQDVYDTYKRQTGGAGPPHNLVPLERSAQTAASESVSVLERRMTWLATIASASPFIGLFGTVIGIIDAFHGLGTEGSATLRAVAPGISEALITTAAGLFVAVPAVIAYNQLSARIRIFASTIDDFSRELLNSLEEIPMRAPAPGQGADASRGGERGIYQ